MDTRMRKATTTWLATSITVFALMIVFGITMRLAQGAQISLEPNTFYVLMTMHGLGMAGGLFSGSLAMIWYIVGKYCEPSVKVMWAAWGIFILAAVGLLTATLVGGFGAGWYALYPLPFVNAPWAPWAVGLTLGSLMLMGVAWLLIQLDLLRVMARKYGAGRLLAWDYLGGATPAEELPSAILIATVCTVAGTLGTITGAVTFILYFLKLLSPGAQLDALLLKNTMFMFGHTIVNVCMYCGLCAVYYILPRYTKRHWGVNRVTAMAWNATLFFILFAYFHHLYMDFGQPMALHVLGQVASYGSAIPATAVSILGVGSQMYKAGVRGRLVPFMFVLGVMGWAIGGVAAVVDSTIVVNVVFHNTLWVPAHFHTYFLVGFVLLFLGFLHEYFKSKAEGFAFGSVFMMLFGGYGFLLMFYLGGMSGVPRRFASYTQIPFGHIAVTGGRLAAMAAVFASVFLIGLFVFIASLLKGRPTIAAGASVGGDRKDDGVGELEVGAL